MLNLRDNIINCELYDEVPAKRTLFRDSVHCLKNLQIAICQTMGARRYRDILRKLMSILTSAKRPQLYITKSRKFFEQCMCGGFRRLVESC
jgi:hypothetical protein